MMQNQDMEMLFEQLAELSEEEKDKIIDTGIFDSQIKGYIYEAYKRINGYHILEKEKKAILNYSNLTLMPYKNTTSVRTCMEETLHRQENLCLHDEMER